MGPTSAVQVAAVLPLTPPKGNNTLQMPEPSLWHRHVASGDVLPFLLHLAGLLDPSSFVLHAAWWYMFWEEFYSNGPTIEKIPLGETL